MIHERLREYRRANRLTQQQLANALGIDRSTYAYYETGRSSPSVLMLKRIADMFRVSLESLVGESGGNEVYTFSDGVSIYHAGAYEEDAEKKYLSQISKEEQDLILLYRLIKDKEAAIELLRQLGMRNEE